MIDEITVLCYEKGRKPYLKVITFLSLIDTITNGHVKSLHGIEDVAVIKSKGDTMSEDYNSIEKSEETYMFMSIGSTNFESLSDKQVKQIIELLNEESL